MDEETNPQNHNIIASAALASAGMSTVLAVIIVIVKSSSTPRPPLVLDGLVMSIPATALLGVFLGILARKTALGKSAIIGGGIIAVICLVIAVPNLIPRSGAGQAAATVNVLHLGDDAPPFDVKTVDGAPLRLANFKGKLVLVDFWATWCGPCVGEMPFLKATYNTFSTNDRFAMISLSLDNDPSAPQQFAHKNDIKWTQGFLGKWSDSTVTHLYGVEGIPSIFLIGPDGRIIARDLRGDAIKETVGKALKND